MSTTHTAGAQLLERLRAATETLELVAADRGTLALLSEDEHRRLRAAAALVCNPDVRARRTMAKALARRRRRERSERDEGVLAETGIRTLRRTAGVHDAKYLPPRRIRAEGSRAGRRLRGPRRSARPTGDDRAAALLRLQAEVHRSIHHFYDQLVPGVRERSTSRSGRELADLRGRVALLTGGRVKIGYQAGLKLLRCGRAPDRHDALSARFGGALRAGAGFRRVGRPAGDLRPGSAPHAERRGVLPRAAGDPRPARLHRQQRVPDRPPSAGVLRAHDGGRDGGAARHVPGTVRKLLAAVRRACAAVAAA